MRSATCHFRSTTFHPWQQQRWTCLNVMAVLYHVEWMCAAGSCFRLGLSCSPSSIEPPTTPHHDTVYGKQQHTHGAWQRHGVRIHSNACRAMSHIVVISPPSPSLARITIDIHHYNIISPRYNPIYAVYVNVMWRREHS